MTINAIFSPIFFYFWGRRLRNVYTNSMQMFFRSHLLKHVTMLASLNRNWHKSNRNHISHLITTICNKYVSFAIAAAGVLYCRAHMPIIFRNATPSHKSDINSNSSATIAIGQPSAQHRRLNTPHSLHIGSCAFFCVFFVVLVGQFGPSPSPWSGANATAYATTDCCSNSTFLVAHDTSISAPAIFHISYSVR